MQISNGSRPTKRINILTTALGIVALVLLAVYLYRNREVFTSLRSITPWQVVLIILIETINFMIGSALNYSMVRRFGYHVSLSDSILLQYINSFLNKILPTIGGGAAFRAVYLKKKYGFPYTQFVSTLGGFYLISFIATSLIGLICMLVFYLQRGVVNWIIILAFFALLIPSLVIVIFSPRLPEKPNRVYRAVRNVAEGWNILKQDTRFIAFYTALIILQLLLSSWQMLIGFQAIGVQTGFTEAVFLSSLGIILAFLNFTPDGIGIREVVYMFTSSVVKIPQSSLVLGSLVLRALSIFTSLVVGGVGYLVFLRQMKKMGEKETL